MNSPLGPESLPKGLIDDVKAVLINRDGAAMLRVAKNASYFNYAIAMYVLVQLAFVLRTWMGLNKSISAIQGMTVHVGVDPLDLVLNGVIGVFIGLASMALVYIFSQKLFEAKPGVTLKEFMTIACIVSFPMVLSVLPLGGLGMLAGGIWAIVLFFTMMQKILGLTFGKALVVAILAGVAVGVVQMVLYNILGFGAGNYSFDFSYGS
ncbi:MAG: YIP1 family protein [Candidatus Gracilibacteria bacterium]